MLTHQSFPIKTQVTMRLSFLFCRMEELWRRREAKQVSLPSALF